jgi:hypothetical protein
MRHRAVVLRDANAGTTGRWNTPAAPDFQPLDDPIACWLWSSADRTVEGPAVNVTVEDLRMMVPLEADVTSADHIGTVTDRRGRVIDAREMKIEADQVVAGSHRELVLTAIAGGV